MTNNKNELCIICHTEPRIPHKARCLKCQNEYRRKWYHFNAKASERMRKYHANRIKTDPEYKEHKRLQSKKYMKTYCKSEPFSLSTIKSHMQRLSIINLDIAINMLTERRIELMSKHKKSD